MLDSCLTCWNQVDRDVKVAQNAAEVLIRLQLILLARSLDQEVDDARCRAPIGPSERGAGDDCRPWSTQALP